MKSFCIALAFSTLSATVPASASTAEPPVSKVIEMLTELSAKITAEGEAAKKLFAQKTEWCEDTIPKLEFSIKTGKTEIAELTAAIEKETAKITALSSKVETLSADIATDEADLAQATKMRETENADFTAEEKELLLTINTLERAISIITREMNGGASMLQLKNAQSMTQALEVMVHASAFSAADASRLTALVQTKQQSGDSDADEESDAPAAAVYKSHSGSIVETLEDLLEKAQGQLDSARKAEMTSLHNFQMLKQSIVDELKFGEKDLDDAKAGISASEEAKAGFEGDLSVTSKSLEADEAQLAEVKEGCLSASEMYEAESKSRSEELAAIAKAKEVIQEAIPGAALNQLSFVQVKRVGTMSGKELINFEVVHFVRDLGRKHHSAALAQLSSKIASVIRLGAADPFSKVKGLISDMIDKLEGEASADATLKDWCDKETAANTAKKEELQSVVQEISTKIGKKSAAATKLKEEVAELEKELADIAKAEAEADEMRVAEKAAFEKESSETSTAIEGVSTALKVLRDYYGSEGKAHEADEGTANSIIALLEVCLSDFSKALAEMKVVEAQAAAAYEKMKKENEITVATKEQDVKYKTKEAAALGKAITEAQADLDSVQAELDAVLESLASIEKKCTSPVESYEERKARREAEIAGLKEALTILEEQTVLIETKSRRMLRGKA